MLDNSWNSITLVIMLIVTVPCVIGMWQVFTKAGRPGWTALIPIYNLYGYLKVAGKSGWLILLYLVPVVNFIVDLFVSLGLARRFGRSTLFGVVAIWLVRPVGLLILGFGNAEYESGGQSAGQQPPVA